MSQSSIFFKIGVFFVDAYFDEFLGILSIILRLLFGWFSLGLESSSATDHGVGDTVAVLEDL